MSTKEIRCDQCNLHLGEIRDARLRKDIAYLCKGCGSIARDAVSRVRSKGSSEHSEMADFLGGMFK